MRSMLMVATSLAITVVVAGVSWVSTLGQDNSGKAPDSGTEASSVVPEFIFPRIEDHGKVVRLPKAVDQPRDGSKICVDITAGGPAEKVNPAIEKVARFVNIYAGAGNQPANARITVVLHGDATLTALSAEAYAATFQTDGNPNLRLFNELIEAGVELLVCGQALSHKGVSPDDIADEVEVAVSALTVNVNRQLDGFAFIPLH